MDWSIQSHPLRCFTTHAVVAVQVREIAATAQHGCGVTRGSRSGNNRLKVIAHPTEALEVLIHQVLGFASAHVELLAQSKRRQTISQAIGHGFDLATHLSIYLRIRHPEHLRGHRGVQVFPANESRDKPLVAGQVRHDPHFDLGIVSRHERLKTWTHDETTPNATTLSSSYRNILEIGIGGRQTTRGGNGLHIGRANSIIS